MRGEIGPPFAAWIDRLCQEFHCDPLRAELLVARAPVGWLEEILESREYVAAYDLVKHTEADKLPASPLVDLVQLIDAELVVDAYRAKQRRGGSRG